MLGARWTGLGHHPCGGADLTWSTQPTRPPGPARLLRASVRSARGKCVCCVLRYFEFCSARSQAPRGGVVVYTQRKYRKIEIISLSGCTLLRGCGGCNKPLDPLVLKRATSTMPVPSSEKRVHTHHGLYSITGAQRTVQTLTVRAAAWLLLRFACGRRLVEGLDMHRDGGRPGRSRAHVGDEHVRALRVAGGKTPVGVERADEGGVTRVPVYAVHVQLRCSSVHTCWNERGGPTRPRPASRLLLGCAPGCVGATCTLGDTTSCTLRPLRSGQGEGGGISTCGQHRAGTMWP